MFPQTQTLTSHLPPSILLPTSTHFFKSNFFPLKRYPFLKSSFQPLKCSVSVVSEPTHLELNTNSHKPFPAEVSRTIMELSSVGTLSTLTQDGWPLGIGVRFAVDSQGTPVLCLNASNRQFSMDRSTLHVQLEQTGLRTPQCTIQGSLDKPEDRMLLKKLHSIWKTRFGEEVNEDYIYIVAVERVFQMEDFAEDGTWVTSSDYRMANPDPLRDFAERLVDEINTHNMEDVHRFSNIYVDLDFPWVFGSSTGGDDLWVWCLRQWALKHGVFPVVGVAAAWSGSRGVEAWSLLGGWGFGSCSSRCGHGELGVAAA